MTINKQPGRQGDVMLIPVQSIPDDAERIVLRTERIVLVEGEATGHHHSVATADAELYATADEAQRYLRVTRETALTHQEHPSIVYPPGDYLVFQKREYVPKAPSRPVFD